MAYREVVVAVDGSRGSEVALQRAVEIGRAVGARLTVVGVEEPTLPSVEGTQRARLNGRFHAAVEAAVEVARRAGIEAEGQVIDGYPAEVIVRYCAERGCDLVVVGTSDEGTGWLGGTADKVVDLAPCAVLVAR